MLSNFYNVLYTRIFALFTSCIHLTEIYDFWHSHTFVSVYAVAIKVQPFESGYNGAYKELNFVCLLCFLAHILHFKCGYFFSFLKNTKLQHETSISTTFGR